MSNTIIAEGKTTAEAVENGLKELKVSKNQVDIKVLEEEHKKSFFSILTPRVVKVELTLKENAREERTAVEKPKREYEHNEENINDAKTRIQQFLNTFLKQIDNELEYTVKIEDYTVMVNINGKSAGILIGYRGETLNAMQIIISTIANNNFNNKIRVILDIENYRDKREKVLEDLAEKVSKTVIKTNKSITLEPMSPYERKIIHSKLQDNSKVETYSIGEGNKRRVVIAKIKNN